MGAQAYVNANKNIFKQNIQNDISNMFKSILLGAQGDICKEMMNVIDKESGNMADQIVDFVINTVTNIQLTGPGPIVSTIITPGFGSPATGALPFTGIELNAN